MITLSPPAAVAGRRNSDKFFSPDPDVFTQSVQKLGRKPDPLQQIVKPRVAVEVFHAAAYFY